MTKRGGKPLETPSQEHTLTEFVEANHRLITVLGVFTALTVFSSSLELRPFGYLLSFLFMTLAILIWFELWSRFPSKPGTWKLTWFENVLSFTVLALVAYWLVFFRSIWHTYLVLLVAGLLLAGITSVMWRYNVFERFFKARPGQKKFLRYSFGIVLVLLVLFISFLVADVVAGPVNTFLDAIREGIQTPSP